MTAVSQVNDSILSDFLETRKMTRRLVSTLQPDDYTIQSAYYTSPPKWHLGHVSWLYEIILSKIRPDYKPNEDYFEYLNSYYNQFGTPHDKGKRGQVARPTTDEILQYYDVVSENVAKFLANNALDEQQKYHFTMTINHEWQHQELLVYDLQHMLAEKYRPAQKNAPPIPAKIELKSVRVDGGLYSLGYSGDKWCYDIELPEHTVYLASYNIDILPVTNGEYIKFIEDGGYSDYKFWLSDGWEAAKKHGWEAPMYWTKEDGRWYTADFGGKRKVNPNEPVVHVSFYEADAFCKWAKKRLPTEAEWEKAACWNEHKKKKTVFPWGNDIPQNQANLLESEIWSCTEVGSFPDGKSHYGCHQMIGDVWEWTSSEYVGYPGFKSGFSEYNDKWFTNQKVLRGGSFATPRRSIRSSYRNFFRLDERWMFSGFRCASDV
jgi:ergothioneine biosynthesis protein EgtB